MRRHLRLILLISSPVLFALLFTLSPQPVQVYLLQQEADWAYRAGFYDMAADKYSLLLSRQPFRIDLLERTGLAYYRSGDVENAEAFLKQAYHAGVLSLEGRIDLADVLIQKGAVDLPLEIWMNLMHEKKGESIVYPKLVKFWRSQGDLEKCRAILEKWAEFDPSNIKIKYELLVILFTQNPSVAMASYSSMPVNDPEWKGRFEQFSRSASLAMMSNPEGAYLWIKVGRALASLGEWDLAAAAFKRSLDINPQYADAYAFLGEAQQNLGVDGLAYLQKAQQLNPDSMIVKALLSVYWRRQGKPQVGLVYLQSAAQLEPDQPIWQVELGNTLSEMGDLISALAHFQTAIRLEPGNPLYWVKLGGFCADHEIELNTIGIQAARQAVLLAPNSPETLDLMGRILLLTGDFVSAERFLQRALEQEPDYLASHFHLGQLYIKAERYEQARDHLLQVAQSGSKQKEVVLARRLLETYFSKR